MTTNQQPSGLQNLKWDVEDFYQDLTFWRRVWFDILVTFSVSLALWLGGYKFWKMRKH